MAAIIAHTGQYLAFPATLNLADLQQWIATHVNIPTNRQIILTLDGKSVKKALEHEEVYVYDKNTLSASASIPADRDESLPDLPEASPPSPDASPEQRKMAAEQTRNWALEACEVIRESAGTIETLLYEADAINSSVIAALANLKNSLKSTSQKFDLEGVAEVTRKQLRQLDTDTLGIERYLCHIPEYEVIGRALHFASDHVPDIKALMNDLRKTPTHRNAAVRNYFAAMREISDVQSQLGRIRAAVAPSATSRDDLVDPEKARLEARLRASDSRVRKLEDLLHRQSHENPSQRIGALEAQVQKLQSEAYDERRSSTESRDKMQEAESVKQDLMANFDAQRQEFDEERQLMDDENHKLKIRIEELEDELDRILGSRDHLKQTNEQKFAGLRSELETTRDAQREAEQKSKIQIENLEKDVNVQLERVAHLEKQVHEGREERRRAGDQNEAELNSLRAAVEEERAQRKAAQDELSNVQGDISGLRSRLATGTRAKELSDMLINYNDRVIRMLTQFGFSISQNGDNLVIQRASKVGASTTLANTTSLDAADTPAAAVMNQRVSQVVAMANSTTMSSPDSAEPILPDPEWAHWPSENQAEEDSKFALFKTAIESLDFPYAIDTMVKRYKDVESLARKYQKDSRAYRDKANRIQVEAHDKIAYRSFKDGDLALFLPTRNQATRPWAAFNVGAPHYFLREQDHHKLQSRDWLLARISKVEERIVDLSRSLSTTRGEASTHAEAGDTASARSVEDENPFELSDGLRWYLLDAAEEKPGAPGTPSVGKSTVTASNVEAEATMGRKEKAPGRGPNAAQVAKTLNKSLESRRSSSASKRSGSLKRDSASLRDGGAPAPLTTADSSLQGGNETSGLVVKPGDSYHGPAREDARVFDIVREDLLQGP